MHRTESNPEGIPDKCFTNVNTVSDCRNLTVTPSLLSLEEAAGFLPVFADPVKETIEVPLFDAYGHILAEDLYSTMDQPPFPRSPFDGYAVRSEDTLNACESDPVRLRVIGEVCAGGWFRGKVGPGEAVRIMTGAPIPSGADAVIKQEETDYGEGDVLIYRKMRHDQNYIYPGEDYKKGTLLLKKGDKLGPAEVAIAASTGMETLNVFRKSSVLIISTGDELETQGNPLAPGKIYDSNLYMSALQLKEWGCEIAGMVHTPDDPDSCSRLIADQADKVDLIITIGGVSVGKKDIMHAVYESLHAAVIFRKIKIKPGGAMMSGLYKNTLILSLSGNPYAAYANMQLIVREVVAKLNRDPALHSSREQVVLMSDYAKDNPMRCFIRCHVQKGKAYLDGHKGGNGDVAASRCINALIDLPAGAVRKKAGDIVSVVVL